MSATPALSVPTARKQAQRLGAKFGRALAWMHLASGAHRGELNRIRKRLRDDRTAETICEAFVFDLGPYRRWRTVMCRAFRRAALGLLATPPIGEAST